MDSRRISEKITPFNPLIARVGDLMFTFSPVWTIEM